MSALVGCLLVPTPKNPDTGLWFIFHHESEGVLAFDLTTEHPDIPYRHFEAICNGESLDKTVLLGGPMQADSAMLVLHNDQSAPDSHRVSDDFLFISRRFVLVAGQPPRITTADDVPSRIDLSQNADFIISIGFRLWNMDDLEEQLKNWEWHFLPASSEIVFRTPRGERLQKALRSIN